MKQLKYNIKRRLSKLNRDDHEKVMKKIFKACPVTRTTFWRWANIEQGKDAEIPYTHQKALAEIFGVHVDELTNPVTQPI